MLSTATPGAPSNVSAKKTTIVISANNTAEVYYNQKRLGRSKRWQQASTCKVAVQKGKGIIAVKAKNKGGKPGLVSKMKLTLIKAKITRLISEKVKVSDLVI